MRCLTNPTGLIRCKLNLPHLRCILEMYTLPFLPLIQFSSVLFGSSVKSNQSAVWSHWMGETFALGETAFAPTVPNSSRKRDITRRQFLRWSHFLSPLCFFVAFPWQQRRAGLLFTREQRTFSLFLAKWRNRLFFCRLHRQEDILSLGRAWMASKGGNLVSIRDDCGTGRTTKEESVLNIIADILGNDIEIQIVNAYVSHCKSTEKCIVVWLCQISFNHFYFYWKFPFEKMQAWFFLTQVDLEIGKLK